MTYKIYVCELEEYECSDYDDEELALDASADFYSSQLSPEECMSIAEACVRVD